MVKTPQQPKKEKEEKSGQSSADLLVERREELPRFYSNHLVSFISPWDIELLFAELFKDQQGGFTSRAVVSVMLSPQHAKAVARLLTAQVEKYEEAYGAVPELGSVQATKHSPED